MAQELPLCIFAPDLAKVPPAMGKGSAPGAPRNPRASTAALPGPARTAGPGAGGVGSVSIPTHSSAWMESTGAT